MSIKKVLLSGGRAPSTLELARLFSKQNIEVHIADSFAFPITKKSKSVKKFHLVSKPKQETLQFIQDLIQIIRNEKIDLYIPTCEEIFFVSKHKNKLSSFCQVLVDDFEKMKLLHNKFTFIEYSKSLGLKVPKTLLISSVSDWLEFNNSNAQGEKFIAKPVFSRFSNDLRFLPEESNKIILPSEENKWVIQEFIVGEQYCTYSLVENGEILAHTTYKTEYRAGKGASIAFTHVNEEKIEQWIETFVRNLNFTGQIAFDFIKNSEGETLPIECNPRLTSGIHLFRETNFINMLVSKTESESQIVFPDKNNGMKITLAMILYSFQNIKERGIGKFLKTLLSYKDVLFDKNDLKPLFYQYYSYYHIWKLSKKHNMGLLEATTYDLSWDGEDI